VDELERGTSGLKLADLERPYFIEYAISDQVRSSVSARLGAIVGDYTFRNRQLRTDVRVGSYELDNTNFEGQFGGFDFGDMSMGGEAAIPIEDDYAAIRQGIWWATDRAYKEVVEELAKKKAFMQGKVIEDKPDDFSKEPPTTHLEPRIPLSLDSERLRATATELSAVFQRYPALQTSDVAIEAGAENRYLVNGEGTRLRRPGQSCTLTVSASVQAEDGMKLSDSFSVHVRKVEELPPTQELTTRCRALAEQLIALQKAPKLEGYTGPVLLEPRAAAEVFSGQLADRFAGGQRPLGSEPDPEDLANKLGKRILPRFMDVVDDPTLAQIAGAKAAGHYKFDDQGVLAQKVQLVDNGRLQALVMSRNPSKEFKRSTGHGRGEYGPEATTGNLIVTAEPASDSAGLREDLLEACEDEDLPHALRVEAMTETPSEWDEFGFAFGMFGDFGHHRAKDTPLIMYKVFPGGREELVRGGERVPFDLKSFKRILAAGDKPYVLNFGGNEGRTVAVPALLFEELDVAKVDRDFDKPPIIPSPLARAGT
jgi:hypothetical protein